MLGYGTTFKTYRNTLTSAIRKAKENYYKQKLEGCAGNSKKTWEILNNIMGKSNNQLPTSIKLFDKTSSTNLEIAESINNYFCNIASNLASNVENTPMSFENFLPDPTPFFFFYSTYKHT